MTHLRYNKEKSKVGTPPGSILMFPASADIPGYLKCNGQVVSKKDYPTLYAIIGDAFKKPGETIAPTQFQLPDLGSKKIIANNSVRDEKYANVYLDDDNPSGGTRAGILINVESEIGNTYDLRYKGEFDFPDRVYTIDGEPKVTFALGNNTEEAEITQFNFQSHGHYHSGKRSRIEPEGGESAFFRPNQVNFYRRKSSLDVGLWERNTYQLACDYYISTQQGIDWKRDYVSPDNNGCQCIPFRNLCRDWTRRCGYSILNLPLSRQSNLFNNFCIYSGKNGNFPYRMSLRYENGNTNLGNSDGIAIWNMHPRSFSGILRWEEDSGKVSGGDNPSDCGCNLICLGTCGGCNPTGRQATEQICWSLHRSYFRNHVNSVSSFAQGLDANYNEDAETPNDRDNLPFDGRQSDSPRYCGIRNVTTPTNTSGTDQTHVHYVQRRIDGHKFQLRALANRISATPLTSVVKVRTTTAEKLDRISQPFIIQEFFIKF